MGLLDNLAGIIGIGSTVAGTFFGARGQRDAGQAAQRQAQFRARVTRNNAALAEEAAEETLEIGRTKQAFVRLATRQLIGRQRVFLAANGVVVDKGSALDLQVDAAVQGDLQARLIAHAAERDALNLRRRAEFAREEAGLLEVGGADVAAAGRTAAFGSILEGVGLVASRWSSAFG